MKPSPSRFILIYQRGVVSILSVLALSLVVLVILAQSLRMNGTKSLEAQQALDSVTALGIAESGMELAVSQIIRGFNNDPSLSTSCNLGPTPSAEFSMGGMGSDAGYRYMLATTVNPGASNSYCKVRVKGRVREANRTLEARLNFNQVYGTSGYGTDVSLSLQNNYGVKAVALFNLAWMSSGGVVNPEPNPPNVTCTTCSTSTPPFTFAWEESKPGNGNGLGGAGNYVTPISNGEIKTLTQKLQAARNYVMEGIMMGGSATAAPEFKGAVTYVNPSAGQSSQTQKNMNTWCSDPTANVALIGIAGKGPGIVNGAPDLTAGFDQAYLGEMLPGSFVKKVHYPNPGTPNAWGDLFAEIYYYYAPNITITGASAAASSTTVTLSAANYLLANAKDLYVQSGSDIPYITRITDVAADYKSFTLSRQVPKLTNATICAGICGLIPPDKNTSVTLKLTPNGAAETKGWIAGLSCFKGVDDRYVKVLFTSAPRVFQWHEVISGE